VRYLITGHTGFKGAWLAAILKAQGHEILGISLPPEKNSLYESAQLRDYFQNEFFIDIRDRELMSRTLSKLEFDAAIHLAAQPLVRESYRSPIETFETNVMGTLNLLDAYKEHTSKPLVVVTTDKVYKNKNQKLGYLEEDELGGHDPYSASKAAADIATQSWLSSFNCENISIARAGNVIGGGDWGVDRLIPDLVAAFESGKPATIRYPNAIRPWQHVADCLSGYLSLSNRMVSDKIAGIWNFGPEINSENSVRKVADLACAYWGSGASWEFQDGDHAHETGPLLLDSSKARESLGWADKLDFDQAIAWTIDFYKASSRGASPRIMLETQVDQFLSL
jgi:CDP-glucose 4,6-dehydratase